MIHHAVVESLPSAGHALVAGSDDQHGVRRLPQAAFQRQHLWKAVQRSAAQLSFPLFALAMGHTVQQNVRAVTSYNTVELILVWNSGLVVRQGKNNCVSWLISVYD